jgi:dTDP-4-dehydrorhamnose 3,5-epimerase
MSRFVFHQTPLTGLRLVERRPIEDARGFLARVYCAEEFLAAHWHKPVLQINHTLTRKRGTVRGLHFQHPPYVESKLVSCFRGHVFDVAVDLRRDSPTFLRWHGEHLSAENRFSMLIPEGFAHGFQALADDCELIYLHTACYQASAEGALNVSDPTLGIAWPLPITELSERDRAHPLISAGFQGIQL